MLLLSNRKALLPFGFLTLIGIFIIYLLFCQEDEGDANAGLTSTKTRYSVKQMREWAFKNAITSGQRQLVQAQQIITFNRVIENFEENRYNIGGHDVIVFLHIQKTAGTSFERFLVRHLNVSNRCVCDLDHKKKCDCRRPDGRIWLFSRYSTGWACGLHADYTELIVSGCVNNKVDIKEGKQRKRRYFLTTFLRDPVDRFISEYSHVERGATWAKARNLCNGRQPSPDELPMCFDPDVGWDGVGLDEFLSCPYNLAFNRQTRMLADLTLVQCYNSSAHEPRTREKLLLESAKRNLRQFSFFGLKERMQESQLLFEHTLGLRFDANLADWNKSKSAHVIASETQLLRIRERNALDLELYAFAEKLFERRLAQIGSLNENGSNQD